MQIASIINHHHIISLTRTYQVFIFLPPPKSSSHSTVVAVVPCVKVVRFECYFYFDAALVLLARLPVAHLHNQWHLVRGQAVKTLKTSPRAVPFPDEKSGRLPNNGNQSRNPGAKEIRVAQALPKTPSLSEAA